MKSLSLKKMKIVVALWIGLGGCQAVVPLPQGCVDPASLINLLQNPGKIEDLPGVPVGLNVLLPKFECAQAPSAENCCMPDNPLTDFDEERCCQAYRGIENDRVARGMSLDESARTPFNPQEAERYNAACVVVQREVIVQDVPPPERIVEERVVERLVERPDQRTECERNPSLARCCIPDNPATEWDENRCCVSYKEIEAARLAAGMTLEQSAVTPFTPEEAQRYNDACLLAVAPPAALPGGPPPPGAQFGPGQPAGVGGPQQNQQAQRPAAVTIECRCDNEEDKVENCSRDGIACCFAITQDGRPTPFTCELKIPETVISSLGASQKDLFLGIGTHTLTWKQASGHQKVGVAGVSPTGEELTGVTTIHTVHKTIATEPPDTMVHGLGPIALAGGKVSTPVEEYQFTVEGTTINGAALFSAFGSLRFATTGGKGGGGCGSCSVGGIDQRPEETMGNLLIAALLLSLPFIGRRRFFSSSLDSKRI